MNTKADHNLEVRASGACLPPSLAGIISCLALNPDRTGMLAAGAYSGVAALYDAAARGALIALLEGHTGGVTQVPGWLRVGGWCAAGGGCSGGVGGRSRPTRPAALVRGVCRNS